MKTIGVILEIWRLKRARERRDRVWAMIGAWI